MKISALRALVDWLDKRGDLLCVSGRIFAFGPLLFGAALLTFLRAELGVPTLFWAVAVFCFFACAFYYAAFILALARQRERFYQKEVKPMLSREYRDE
jgi:hypothetical protein